MRVSFNEQGSIYRDIAIDRTKSPQERIDVIGKLKASNAKDMNLLNYLAKDYTDDKSVCEAAVNKFKELKNTSFKKAVVKIEVPTSSSSSGM